MNGAQELIISDKFQTKKKKTPPKKKPCVNKKTVTVKKSSPLKKESTHTPAPVPEPEIKQEPITRKRSRDEPTADSPVKQKKLNRFERNQQQIIDDAARTTINRGPDLSQLIDIYSIILAGMSGSGKTTLMKNLIIDMKNAGMWDRLYIVNPSEFEAKMDSEGEDWKEIKRHGVIISEPDDSLWDQIIQNKHDNLKTLVLMDDVTEFIDDLRNGKKIAGKIFTKGRHKNCRCIVGIHQPKQIGTLARGNAGDVFVTHTFDEDQMMFLAKMIVQTRYKNAELIKYLELVMKEKYVCLHIKKTANSHYNFGFIKCIDLSQS